MSTVQLLLCSMLATSMVVGLLLPAAKKPIPRATDLCIGLLVVAGLAFASLLAFAVVDIWDPIPACAALGLSAIFVSFWVAEAPDGEDDEDGGGGLKRDPPDPSPWLPNGGPDPLIDWCEFDTQREQWADRVPVRL